MQRVRRNHEHRVQFHLLEHSPEILEGVAPGDLQVPLRLRYQACNDRTCFPPSRLDLTATLRVLPAGTPAVPQFGELFKTLRFAR